jgi:septal ring factor EnvC (AmiA/AmiB activator)
MDAELKRLADAAERLESQARELRGGIEALAAATRARAEAEAARAEAENARAAARRAETVEPSPTAADDSEARIVAYSMVLDGKSREEVARHLADELGLSNSDALLDDLYARAS